MPCLLKEAICVAYGVVILRTLSLTSIGIETVDEGEAKVPFESIGVTKAVCQTTVQNCGLARHQAASQAKEIATSAVPLSNIIYVNTSAHVLMVITKREEALETLSLRSVETTQAIQERPFFVGEVFLTTTMIALGNVTKETRFQVEISRISQGILISQSPINRKSRAFKCWKKAKSIYFPRIKYDLSYFYG